jgi:phenolic acid decarboxylase
MSLPSPLTASDEWVKARDINLDVVKVTAGLHRQVWVSGTSIYVDVHIVNNSRKAIRKIELQLERDILCYKHVCPEAM